MKREIVLLVFGTFLMVFMIGVLIAEESTPVSPPSSGGGGGGGGGSADKNYISLKSNNANITFGIISVGLYWATGIC